eukprot:TRINITY_DN444_c0_g1_i1.p1 TRINITY_DN444_c0_g1~~TRINITY_DN444_c0_g1_i1.p1  ORF type:complete len:511 (-),score=130.26 TRINITY_DN444_c0_g1_i1:320-1852(-)
MGACLPKAVESTVIERAQAESFTVGVAEMNGWRSNMEDAHLIFMRKDWGFFGVFDGHGGDQCSKFVAPRMNEILEAEGCPGDDQSVKEMVLRVDKEFLDSGQGSGSTATMCIIRKPTIAGGKHGLHVINAGDSRVLLGRADGTIVSGGDHCTEEGLTVDHKPCHPSEYDRIYRCGGYVEQQPGGVARVNGDLAVSRGYGDAEYKKTGGPGPEDRPVTANPEMGHYECDATDFLMLVCDGVSEGNFPNPEVVQLAAKVLRETGGDAGLASKAVIHKALEANSKDNITCMIVLLNGGEASHSVDYVPGPLFAPDNAGFMSAYSCMAQKANLTLAKAVELRYDMIEDAMAKPGLEKSVADELKEEMLGIGSPTGAKGSAERAAWFADWEKNRPQGGGARGGQMDEMEMMRQMMQRPGGTDALMNLLGQQQQQQGQAREEEPEDGRKVRAAPLQNLKAAVDEHSALQWDERMQALAGQEGVVKTDDASDGTSQVRFPAPIGMVAWLPTSILDNL